MGTELTVTGARDVVGGVAIPALVEEWAAHMARRVAAGEIAEATRTTYLRGMRRFSDWLDTQNVPFVDGDTLLLWKAGLLEEHKPTGANVFFAGVRAFFRWAKAHRGLLNDPTEGIRGATRRNSRRHVRSALTDAEVLRVLAQPDTSNIVGVRDRAMLLLLAYVGLRSIEVQRARIADLRSDGMLKLWVHGKGHGSADEFVFLINTDLVGAMYDWLAEHPRGDDLAAPLFCGVGNRNTGGPLSMQAIRKIVKAYYRAAGIRDRSKTTHSLRHSLVTNLLAQGVPIPKIMSVTRHRDPGTLLGYAHEMQRESDPAEAHVNYGGA